MKRPGRDLRRRLVKVLSGLVAPDEVIPRRRGGVWIVNVRRNPRQVFAKPDGRFVYLVNQRADPHPDTTISVTEVATQTVIVTLPADKGQTASRNSPEYSHPKTSRRTQFGCAIRYPKDADDEQEIQKECRGQGRTRRL